jgi:hypothetical protein
LRAGEGVSQREDGPHATGGTLLDQRTRMPAKRLSVSRFKVLAAAS